MKKLDQGRVSLVDFMRSIKFDRRGDIHTDGAALGRFAGLDARARSGNAMSAEDNQLVRSAN